jgi:hypothetical protein
MVGTAKILVFLHRLNNLLVSRKFEKKQVDEMIFMVQGLINNIENGVQASLLRGMETQPNKPDVTPDLFEGKKGRRKSGQGV